MVPGGTATYTVRVQNTGQVAYTAAHPAAVAVDLSRCARRRRASSAPTTGRPSPARRSTGWARSRSARTVDITYSAGAQRHRHRRSGADQRRHSRVATIGGGCATAAECAATTTVRSFTAMTTASPASPGHGQPRRYRDLHDDGDEQRCAVDYTADAPASFTDDLTLRSSMTPSIWRTGQRCHRRPSDELLTWAGPLAAGASVDVSYAVRVNSAPTRATTSCRMRWQRMPASADAAGASQAAA